MLFYMIKQILREKLSTPRECNPKASSEATRKVMTANKAKDTKPELTLRKALWNSGIKGYRTNWKTIPGRPDICFIGKKIAIFVNGCFWHRCPHCDLPLPKTNTDFWNTKFLRNKERDQLKIQRLEKQGWKVITIWECEIKKDLPKQVLRVKELFKK